MNNSNPNYRNPILARLKGEHAQLSSEVNLLNRELLILKDVIRNKQKHLRDINIALIYKATRGPFLSIVPSFNSIVLQPTKPLKISAEVSLHCLHGGKHTCK